MPDSLWTNCLSLLAFPLGNTEDFHPQSAGMKGTTGKSLHWLCREVLSLSRCILSNRINKFDALTATRSKELYCTKYYLVPLSKLIQQRQTQYDSQYWSGVVTIMMFFHSVIIRPIVALQSAYLRCKSIILLEAEPSVIYRSGSHFPQIYKIQLSLHLRIISLVRGGRSWVWR